MDAWKLPRSTPEAEGIASGAIVDFLRKMEERRLELHSFMLVRHGKVTAECWWKPYAPQLPHMLFSLSKSFTSTAIGMAAAEGLLSLDDRVADYFPDELPAGRADGHLAAMRIRHLLMMGTGHAEDTTPHLRKEPTGNWARAFLAVPVEHEPGTHFVYNSGATYMLSAILQKAAGVKLLDYLQPRLMEPLAIRGAAWEECPRGVHTGGWGLSIATEDIAKFGQLYLQKGVWHGKRLLSADWIDEATRKQIANGTDPDSDWAQGYGYQFWRCRHGVYRGDGAFGQFCIVFPEQDVVLAITSAVSDMQAVLNGVWEHLLPAMQAEALPVDAPSSAALERVLQSRELEPPQGVAEPAPVEASVSGKGYLLEDNSGGWTSFSIIFADREARIELGAASGVHSFRCGRGEWRDGLSDILPLPGRRVASSFMWRDTGELEVTVRFYETPFYHTIVCRFDDEGLMLESSPNVSLAPIEKLVIRGRPA